MGLFGRKKKTKIPKQFFFSKNMIPSLFNLEDTLTLTSCKKFKKMYERFQKITPKKGANRQTGKWMGGDILFDFTSWVQKMFTKSLV